MKRAYTILNCEGDILRLEIENFQNFTTFTFCANMNNGIGRVYFPVSEKELLEFFNSKITISQVVQNAMEDRFLLIRYDKGYILERSFVAHSLQCGDLLYRDILDDMKIGNKEIEKIISDNQLDVGAAS
jgi:hypothetical protein